MGELPDGWVSAQIAETISLDGIMSDGDWVESKDQNPNGNVRLIQLADIGDGMFKDKSNRFMTTEKAADLRCTYLKKGDVLIARMPDPLGRSCIFPGVGQKSVTVVDICLVRVFDSSTIKNKILMYWVNSPEIRNLINMQATGTTRRRITRKKLEALKIPIPPLNEQIRIANKLDLLLAKVEAAQTRLEKIPTLLKRFRQAVLAAATSGELTREWRERNKAEEWSIRKLSEIANSVSDGDHQAPPKAVNGVPFLVISNVNKGVLNFSNVTRWVPQGYFDSLKSVRIPELNDILYTVTGSYGIPIIINTEQQFCFQRHIAIIKPNHEIIDYRYLKIALGSPVAINQANSTATGTAQKTVSLTSLRGFKIPVPMTEEQKEIVRRVESLFTLSDTVEKQYQLAKKRTDKLTQSILAKAFKGELVPQDPNDEPAEQLLARIRAEREKSAPAKKPRAR